MQTRESDSIVYLRCGHGKFDTQLDCLICCKFIIEQLNQRLSNAAIDLSISNAKVEAEIKHRCEMSRELFKAQMELAALRGGGGAGYSRKESGRGMGLG